MSRSLTTSLCALALISALSGCDQLAGLSGMLSGVPVIGSFFPAPEESLPPLVHHRPRHAAAASAASGSLEAKGTPAPAEIAQWADRNRQFDRLRTTGLMQLYNGQTAAAIASFKSAQALRPHDEQVSRLIDLCLHPAAHLKAQGFNAMPAGAGPAASASLPPVPVARPAAGDKPNGLFQ